MPVYRNIKTGALVEVPCEVKGDWELVDNKKTAPVTKPKKVEEPKVVEEPKKAEAKKKAK